MYVHTFESVHTRVHHAHCVHACVRVCVCVCVYVCGILIMTVNSVDHLREIEFIPLHAI